MRNTEWSFGLPGQMAGPALKLGFSPPGQNPLSFLRRWVRTGSSSAVWNVPGKGLCWAVNLVLVLSDLSTQLLWVWG